jgi:hypothetical protein
MGNLLFYLIVILLVLGVIWFMIYIRDNSPHFDITIDPEDRDD